MRYTSTRCFSIFAGICILVCGLLPRAIAQDSNPPQDSGSFSPQQETYSQAEYDAVYQEVIDSRPNCRVTIQHRGSDASTISSVTCCS